MCQPLFSKILHQIKINGIGKQQKNINVIGLLPKQMPKQINPRTVKIISISQPKKNILSTFPFFYLVFIIHERVELVNPFFNYVFQFLCSSRDKHNILFYLHGSCSLLLTPNEFHIHKSRHSKHFRWLLLHRTLEEQKLSKR